MNLILLGAPGSGKGTQAATLIERFGLAHISTGDILRAAVKAGTPLGLEANKYMLAGKLVPDEVVIGLVEARLQEPDTASGYILDGFPRTTAQADALGAMTKSLGKPIEHVVYLKVDGEELVKRLLGRGRADDTEEAIRTRLKVFQDQTQPLITYYQAAGLLREVHGVGSVDEIGAAIRAAIGA